jgi:hypothetical protein
MIRNALSLALVLAPALLPVAPLHPGLAGAEPVIRWGPVQRADTILPDTILPDTIPEEEPLPEDTLVVRNLPEMTHPEGAGWHTGIWEWNREEIIASRAQTLAELLEELPGVLALRGGDHGNPHTVIGPGLGPGRVRIFVDGAELAPMDGGMVDLSRVGVVGLDRIRVERRPGELRVDLLGFQFVDPRVYSLVEAGTGDLRTNLFRGTFAHPDALGGNVLLALDRIDTDGSFREEPGASFGFYLRHSLVRSDRGGLSWSFRRMTSRRTPEFFDPEDVNRTDWNVRGRYEIRDGILADAFFHRSSLGVNEDRDGEGADTLITAEARSQIGVRLAVDRSGWWLRAEAREQGGEGWPDRVHGLRGGTVLPGVGGISLGAERQSWDGWVGRNYHGRVYSAPLLGVSLFAEAQSGHLAMPRFVPAPRPALDPPEEENGEEDPVAAAMTTEAGGLDEHPSPRFSEATAYRLGAEFRRGDLFLGAAFLSMDPDSLHPTGLPLDRDGISSVVGSRTGVEVSGQLPLRFVLDGLVLRWDAQIWDEDVGWRYAPSRTWDARMSYHNVFFETRNLEIWTDVGMRGRDPMILPFLESNGEEEAFARVPVNQSWYLRVQARIVSAIVFVRWDNFTFRDTNQDFPERVLPATRAMYGVKWTLWN